MKKIVNLPTFKAVEQFTMSPQIGLLNTHIQTDIALFYSFTKKVCGF